MNRLLLVLILACCSTLALFAQGGKGGTTTQTTLTPSTTSSNAPKTSATARGAESNPITPRGSQNRTSTTLGNTTPRQTTTQDRSSTRPADSKPSRPSTYAPPSNNYAQKGITPGVTQKAVALKPSERGQVKWMTIEQALEKCKTEKRKIFVDVYTNWCGWCKHMDSTTFVSPAVAKYLNEHFYPVKFNAEQEQDITFNGKVYRFKKSGTRGSHELAALWLKGRLSFPTVVFLDETQQLIQPVPGYQDAAKMEAIINYFGSDSHKKTPWETYEKNFASKK